MLSAAQRARLTVVLVGARNPQNIGAAARALQDFGFTSMRIVNDFAAPFEAAQLEAAQATTEIKSAVGAQHVMRSAQRFDSLPAAIADCHLIVGTTAIGGRDLHRPIETLQQTAQRILAALGSPAQQPGAPYLDSEMWEGPPPPFASEPPLSRVALLFGSEKTGLTNDHLSHCSLLTTIPLFAPESARHLSMNLGQSVAVCLYELTRAGFEGSRALPTVDEAPVTAADRERLTQLLLQVMGATGYARRFPANAREPQVRQLVQQLAATHLQAETWLGILKHLQAKNV